MNVTPEAVQNLLQSDDFGKRLSAVNQIRQLDPSIGFELIQTAIRDSNVRVRYAAVSQVSSLGEQNPQLALEILRDCLLNDPEPDVQAAAADSLGALHLTEAFEDLQSVYYQTDNWLLQFSIIATLGELGDSRAFDLLQTALQSDNELVQTAAIGSLGELGDTRAVPLLIPLADSEDWQIRHRVAQALGRLDQPEARGAMESLADDAMEPVAEEAQAFLQENL